MWQSSVHLSCWTCAGLVESGEEALPRQEPEQLSLTSNTPHTQAPFLTALTSLADYLSPDILAAVVESRIAEWKASDRADRKPAAKSSKKGKERDKSTADLDAPDGERRSRAADERRARWIDARELLGRTAAAGEAASAATSTSSPSSLPDVRNSQEDAVNDRKAQAVGTKLDDAPRLAQFRLALRTIETTPKAIRINHEIQLGLVFSPEDWNAVDDATVRPLFGRERGADGASRCPRAT